MSRYANKDMQDLIREIVDGGLFSEKSDTYFSWHGCDFCGHAGDIQEYDGYKNLEEAKKGRGNLYDFKLCNGCLNRLYYGEPEVTFPFSSKT